MNIIKGRDSFEKGKRVEWLFIKNERVQGGMGIFALLFFLPTRKQGRAIEGPAEGA